MTAPHSAVIAKKLPLKCLSRPPADVSLCPCCCSHKPHLFHHGVQRDGWKVKLPQHHGEDLTAPELVKKMYSVRREHNHSYKKARTLKDLHAEVLHHSYDRFFPLLNQIYVITCGKLMITVQTVLHKTAPPCFNL